MVQYTDWFVQETKSYARRFPHKEDKVCWFDISSQKSIKTIFCYFFPCFAFARFFLLFI